MSLNCTVSKIHFHKLIGKNGPHFPLQKKKIREAILDYKACSHLCSQKLQKIEHPALGSILAIMCEHILYGNTGITGATSNRNLQVIICVMDKCGTFQLTMFAQMVG